MTFDEAVAATPVIPVIVIDRIEDAVPLARALVVGGLRVLEITLRTPVALGAIARIAGEVEGAFVGAGTVRNLAQLKAAEAHGSRFLVSPGFSAALVEAASVPILPGVSTATEAMAAAESGARFLKLFPAEAVGGVKLLKALHGPFADLRFCPTGGVNAENAPAYLALPNVACVGGSWMLPASAVEAGDWAGIQRLAAAAAALRPAATSAV